MNIMYLHGLDSSPDEGKVSVLRERGHKVITRHFDYRSEPDVFKKSLKLAKETDTNFIVGSSMGGYYGYWLGHALEVGQLLFNPAMPFRSVRVQSQDIEEKPHVGSYVVLGAKDDNMPATFNISFFSTRQSARVVTCEWLGHKVDLDTFRQMCLWAGL